MRGGDGGQGVPERDKIWLRKAKNEVIYGFQVFNLFRENSTAQFRGNFKSLKFTLSKIYEIVKSG